MSDTSRQGPRATSPPTVPPQRPGGSRMPEPTTETPTLQLARWTVTSGSNARSRGAVIIDAGDHHWRASAEGNGAIDALFRAVDQALSEILDEIGRASCRERG